MPDKPKVFISTGNHEYTDMFVENGWDLTDRILDADVVQFTGGQDVAPSLYGERTHPETYCSFPRDHREMLLFHTAYKARIPMAGICRGGQFLNVMCGGSLWQHVPNHTQSHRATDLTTGEDILVTSTHHQMMRPPRKAVKYDILMVASEATWKEKMRGTRSQNKEPVRVMGDNFDVESIFYPEYRCLCFQPHPEMFHAEPELAEVYFRYINTILLKG